MENPVINSIRMTLLMNYSGLRDKAHLVDGKEWDEILGPMTKL